MENKFFSADSSNVKLLGRTLDDNGTRWLILSASGIEFEIEAKSLSFDLLGDECAHPSTKADGTQGMKFLLMKNLSRLAAWMKNQNV